MTEPNTPEKRDDEAPAAAEAPVPARYRPPAVEIGGRRDGTEPTRFGDWEKNGRCIDF